MLKAHILEVS